MFENDVNRVTRSNKKKKEFDCPINYDMSINLFS